MTTGQTRSFGLHLITFAGGAASAISFASSKSVDIYAAWQHLYAGAHELIIAFGILGPIASAAYGIYKATTRNKLLDAAADPLAPQIAREMTATREVVAMADALKQKP